MRIWDLHPGFLNRGSLLGEHRELHGIFKIIQLQQRGYARHPETCRWRGHLGALRRRHDLLVAEMTLRGYRHRSPLPAIVEQVAWPDTFVDPPGVQLEILRRKYRGREPGRIPLPINRQAIWAAHKYSVLARDQELYRSLGRRVAEPGPGTRIEQLAAELVAIMRRAPRPGDRRNALEHMWGHVSRVAGVAPPDPANHQALLRLIVELNAQARDPYLTGSTALSELTVW